MVHPFAVLIQVVAEVGTQPLRPVPIGKSARGTKPQLRVPVSRRDAMVAKPDIDRVSPQVYASRSEHPSRLSCFANIDGIDPTADGALSAKVGWIQGVLIQR